MRGHAYILFYSAGMTMGIQAERLRVALVFFCYREDGELLELAVQAVPMLRAGGDEVDVFLVDDAAAPLEGAVGSSVAGVEYMLSDFDRRGNLNGAECVCGMAEIYEGLAMRGYDWVVKCDCDTFLNSLDWVRGVRADYVGTRHVHDYGSGACYALSRRGCRMLAEAMREPLWQGAAGRAYCEDKAIFHIVRCKGGVMELRDNARNVCDPALLVHDWQTDEVLSMEELSRAAAVDFKRCRWNSKAEAWRGDRESALVRMKEYVELQFTIYNLQF